MKRLFCAWMTIVTVLVVMNSVPGLVRAQQAVPSEGEVQDMARSMGMDPRQCDAIQNQIDRVTSVANSSISDNDKVARLSEFLNQSIEAMKQAASKDQEVAQIVNQYLSMIQGLVAAALNAGKDKSVPSGAAEDLAKLKIMTQTYVQMMKMMCPNLKLPESMVK